MTWPEFAPDPAYSAGTASAARPIMIIGAGGIVSDAHLPAYRKAGFAVCGIVDQILDKAEELAARFQVPATFGSVAEAVASAPADAVYDLALMPDQYASTLRQLPVGAPVLIQKPLGHRLSEALQLRRIIADRQLVAAVNTQLRFAPQVQLARRMIAAGAIGELIDLEIRVSTDTHWELFPQVFRLERLEFTMHSIHYLDLVRSFVGDPAAVSAVTVPHPDKPLPNTRSAVLLHYADRPLRVIVSTNHDNTFGAEHEAASITWQGRTGAIRAQLGLLLDYPRGREDRLQWANADHPWTDLDVEGSWFPDAFIGSMSALQNFLTGRTATLPTAVDDVINTMAVIEAAEACNASPGFAPPYPG